MPEWLRGRFAKPFCVGSSPIITSKKQKGRQHESGVGLSAFCVLRDRTRRVGIRHTQCVLSERDASERMPTWLSGV